MCRAAFFASQKMLLSSARHMNSLTAVACTAGATQAVGAECYALINVVVQTLAGPFCPKTFFCGGKRELSQWWQ